MQLDQLRIEKKSSGKLSLFVTERVSYEKFPIVAREFLNLVGGIKLFSTDGPDIRMWTVLIKFRPYFLVFDDFPWGLSLDPMKGSSDKVIQNLYKQLNEKDI